VARAAPEGKILFGHFFGPKLNSLDEVNLEDIEPGKSILSVIFGDLGLINGEWRIIGSLPNWKRGAWSMSDFVRRDPISKRAWRIRYSDVDPSKLESEVPTEFDTNLPADLTSGYGAVELKLTKLLG
jgi:Immunity protein 26